MLMRTKKYFTLIEIIIVITIIAVLMAFLLPAINNSVTNAKIADVEANMKTIIAGYDSYKEEYGVYPENVTHLNQDDSTNNPNRVKFPGSRANTKTPWGEDYVIIVDGSSLDTADPDPVYQNPLITGTDGQEYPKQVGIAASTDAKIELDATTIFGSVAIYAAHPKGGRPITSWSKKDERND